MRQLIRTAMTITLVATSVVVAGSPAEAATIQVTTTLDEGLDNGLTSLREAIDLADGNGQGDTIVLPAAGFFIIDFCAAGALEHAADEDLTIDGNGAVIQQTCEEGELFRHLGPNTELEISDLEMNTGINNSDVTIIGAAVFADHDLTLTNVTITGMDAGSGGSLVDNGNSDGLGDGTFTFTDVEITGNIGTALAPSFVALSVAGSTISDNTGNGIAAVDGTPVTVTDTTVADNGGVGIRTTGQSIGELTVTGSTIRDNADTGIACSNCSEVAIDQTTVLRNGSDISTGGFGGGGIRIDWQTDGFADQPLTATVTNSFVDSNTASQGGAGIDVFEGFLGTDPDGDRASLLVENTSVVDNRPTGFFDLDGGGIRVRTGDLTVIDSTITGNWAGLGNGITSNEGGGIYFRDENQVLAEGSLLVQGSTIAGNLADGSGGGIRAVARTSVVIEDSTVDANEAFGLNGGGIHVSGADTTVLRSTLSGNTAGVGGGLSLNEFSGYPEGSLLVEDSTVNGNTSTFAASGGGGVFVNVGDAGVNATFRNSTVTGNTSANLGGGIMAMQTSSVTLEHATTVENEGATGANVFVAARDLTSASSIIADPLGAGASCDIGPPGSFVSNGGNVVDDGSCSAGPDDVTIAGATLLGPLAPNGGPTLTRLPDPLSPVAGVVPGPVCLPTDQRGENRPLSGECDAGAVEIDEPDVIRGTDGNDRIVGTPGDDIIIAGDGNDRIRGGGGNDVIIGGPGRDIIDGGSGDDEIDGGEGNDIISGRRGDDVIDGGPGRDLIFGGPGDNTLDGGPGRDLCFPATGRPFRC